MRTSSSRWVLAALTFLGVCAPTAVFAYCRTTTCDTCTQPEDRCIQEGLQLFWASRCVSYDLQRDGATQVSLSTATTIADRAFAHWSSAVCPTSNRPPSIAFLDLGPVACGKVEYNDPNNNASPRDGGNANILMFRDTDWDSSKAADPTSTLALTTVTFSRNTGQIFDADIEVNGNKELSISDAASLTGYDLESILTHEIGHFLGLAHSRQHCSGVDCPTMTASYVKGSTVFRTLESDDIAGLCAIYPSNRSADNSSCQPMYGLGSECGIPGTRRAGCSVGRAGSVAALPNEMRGPAAWFGSVLLAFVLRRQRQCRRALQAKTG